MTKEIYLPIIGFGILIFIGFIVKKFFFKREWCPHQESNLKLNLTMVTLCHLTIGAKKQI